MHPRAPGDSREGAPNEGRKFFVDLQRPECCGGQTGGGERDGDCSVVGVRIWIVGGFLRGTDIEHGKPGPGGVDIVIVHSDCTENISLEYARRSIK
jgi:hypothetical protein